MLDCGLFVYKYGQYCFCLFTKNEFVLKTKTE
jgi:hypothetical protein